MFLVLVLSPESSKCTRNVMSCYDGDYNLSGVQPSPCCDEGHGHPRGCGGESVKQERRSPGSAETDSVQVAAWDHPYQQTFRQTCDRG